MPIDIIWHLINFDEHYSTKIQNRLMRKYRRLIQRHLYVHGREKKYLSSEENI